VLRWVRPVRASLMASEGELMKWKVSFAGRAAFVWVAMVFCIRRVLNLRLKNKRTVKYKWRTVLLELKASRTRADKIHEREHRRESLQEYLDLPSFLGHTPVNNGLPQTVMRVLRGFSPTPLRCLWSG
jgi:hypothetical protein